MALVGVLGSKNALGGNLKPLLRTTCHGIRVMISNRWKNGRTFSKVPGKRVFRPAKKPDFPKSPLCPRGDKTAWAVKSNPLFSSIHPVSLYFFEARRLHSRRSDPSSAKRRQEVIVGFQKLALFRPPIPRLGYHDFFSWFLFYQTLSNADSPCTHWLHKSASVSILEPEDVTKGHLYVMHHMNSVTTLVWQPEENPVQKPTKAETCHLPRYVL